MDRLLARGKLSFDFFDRNVLASIKLR